MMAEFHLAASVLGACVVYAASLSHFITICNNTFAFSNITNSRNVKMSALKKRSSSFITPVSLTYKPKEHLNYARWHTSQHAVHLN